MNGYHADLFDHLHQVPPPGYAGVSLAQILRADRAAWLHIAEKITTLKRDEHGNLSLETEIQQVLAHPSVSFHLLPLPIKAADKPKPKPAAQPKRSRSPSRQTTTPSATKGKGKGKKGQTKKGRGPNVPNGLIDKNLRELHLCAEPGCEKAHRLQNHQWSIEFCRARTFNAMILQLWIDHYPNFFASKFSLGLVD